MNHSNTDKNDCSLFTDLNHDEANLAMGGRFRSSSRSRSRFASLFGDGIFSSFFRSRGRSQRTINTDSYVELNSINALNNSRIGNNNIFNIFSFFS